MARRPDHHARIALLGAAEQVFVARGLEGATIEEITSRAGRSKGSFYLHFESKEQAFRQIVESLLARMEVYLEEATRTATPRAPGEVEAALGRWLDHDLQTFEFIWLNRGVFRLLIDGGKSARFEYLVDGFAERAREASAARLRTGIEAGIYRADIDPATTSLFITGAYDRLARDLVHREVKPDLRGQLEAMQRIVLLGLASRAVSERFDRRVKNDPTPRAKVARHPRGARGIAPPRRAEPPAARGPATEPVTQEVRGDRRRRASRRARRG